MPFWAHAIAIGDAPRFSDNMQQPHLQLAGLFLDAHVPYLSGTPQVHYARLAFILALDPVQNVPHSKFSNLTHPPTTSSE